LRAILYVVGTGTEVLAYDGIASATTGVDPEVS